ncbi:hypothetical protein [Lapillicoccus jejuensis]|uniref:WD40 repeat protein n=1 Tax=Lapillicoccus jejuensis TaxID=402171 RepID=A0A542E376_9MICO|nr:hypothetical protein [Lapillicoccus jejuensis]TQJ09777.1 hypothetical protein FB458_2893 [Lapillicoccus jejuensis]
MRRSIIAILGGLAALVLPAAPAPSAAPVAAVVQAAPVVQVAAVSLDPRGRVVGAYPWSLQVSADGGTVLWASDDDVTTVAAGQQWYLLRRATGTVTLVSAAPDGTPADGMHLVSGAALSGDGSLVLLWDRDATTLLPDLGSAASVVLLRRPDTGATSVLRLPTVTTSTRGVARLRVQTAALSADARWVTVGGQVPQGAGAPYEAVVRLDRTTGTWTTLCGGEADGDRCRLTTSSPDGRYAALDRWPAPTVLHDAVTGVERAWPVDADGVPQPCVVAADSTRLVCERHSAQPTQPGGVDTTLVSRALPDLSVVTTLRLRGLVTVSAATAGAAQLAVEARRPGSRLSDAQRVDGATGARATVSVGPDGTPTTMAVHTAGMTADGAVLFTTPDRALADRPAKSRLPRAYLATVR